MTGSAPLTVDDFANFGAGIPIPVSIRRLEQIDLACVNAGRDGEAVDRREAELRAPTRGVLPDGWK